MQSPLTNCNTARRICLCHHCHSTRQEMDPPVQASATLRPRDRAIVTIPAGPTNYGHFVLDCLSGIVTKGVKKLGISLHVFLL